VLRQGDGFGSFAAGAGVLLLGIMDNHGVGQLAPPLTPDHPMSLLLGCRDEIGAG
jgi:hypothetical protein